jgi:hypothetical protein
MAARRRVGFFVVRKQETDATAGCVATPVCFSAEGFEARRLRVGFEPESAGRARRVDPHFLPPKHLVTRAMDLAMMAPAEWYCKFVADLATQRPMLGKNADDAHLTVYARKSDSPVGSQT